MQRDTSEYIAIVEQQIAETRLADLRRILQHGLEYRLQFAGRIGACVTVHAGERGAYLRCKVRRAVSV